MITNALKENFNELVRELTPFTQEIVDGYQTDPGTSDLDDEQPIMVSMSLGNYRKARRLLHALKELPGR